MESRSRERSPWKNDTGGRLKCSHSAYTVSQTTCGVTNVLFHILGIIPVGFLLLVILMTQSSLTTGFHESGVHTDLDCNQILH